MTKKKRPAAEDFILDLTDWPPEPRLPRGWFYPRLDGWSANDSPLEHYYMATATCRWTEDPRACEDERWAQHLRACGPCSRAEVIKEIIAFAEKLRGGTL